MPSLRTAAACKRLRAGATPCVAAARPRGPGAASPLASHLLFSRARHVPREHPMESSIERLVLYGLSAYGLFALVRDGGWIQGFFGL